MQLLDGLKETRGYWKLKEKALDRILYGSRFGRGYGPVVRQTAERLNTLQVSLWQGTPLLGRADVRNVLMSADSDDWTCLKAKRERARCCLTRYPKNTVIFVFFPLFL
jgi:hypothetical protein